MDRTVKADNTASKSISRAEVRDAAIVGYKRVAAQPGRVKLTTKQRDYIVGQKNSAA